MDDLDFTPTQWWRVIGPDGEIWCETSIEHEARRSMRRGDSLERFYQAIVYEWRKEQ